jgi:hypothetical protein
MGEEKPLASPLEMLRVDVNGINDLNCPRICCREEQQKLRGITL